MLDASQPFVLLDDARAEGAASARLYQGAVKTIVVETADEVPAALEQLRGIDGYVAGYLAYEAGLALEPRLAPLRCQTGPLAWFGCFQGYREIAPDDVASLLPSADGAWAGSPAPRITRTAYDAALARVNDYIAAGDIYQANLTFACEVATAGHPLALYAGMRARAGAGYGGVVWTGADWHLSLSPELFFALKDGKITTRPMKGTAARSGNDAAAIETLRSDPKQRAENLMIVDLLRNDLARVAEAGSVAVPELFAVESYPTVHQMVSTVTAQARPGLGAPDVLAAIFPCGSITGAPKIRAMEIIEELEPTRRGIYAGCIGYFAANGTMDTCIGLRTAVVKDGTMYVQAGGGVVADSTPEGEYEETRQKARALFRAAEDAVRFAALK